MSATRRQCLKFIITVQVFDTYDVIRLELVIRLHKLWVERAHLVLIFEDVQVAGVFVAVIARDVPEGVALVDGVFFDFERRGIVCEPAFEFVEICPDVQQTESRNGGCRQNLFQFRSVKH